MICSGFQPDCVQQEQADVRWMYLGCICLLLPSSCKRKRNLRYINFLLHKIWGRFCVVNRFDPISGNPIWYLRSRVSLSWVRPPQSWNRLLWRRQRRQRLRSRQRRCHRRHRPHRRRIREGPTLYNVTSRISQWIVTRMRFVTLQIRIRSGWSATVVKVDSMLSLISKSSPAAPPPPPTTATIRAAGGTAGWAWRTHRGSSSGKYRFVSLLTFCGLTRHCIKGQSPTWLLIKFWPKLSKLLTLLHSTISLPKTPHFETVSAMTSGHWTRGRRAGELCHVLRTCVKCDID